MNKVVTAAVVVLLATIALSAYAYTVYLPGMSNSSSSSNSFSSSGTTSSGGFQGPGSAALSIYLTDNPPTNVSLKYLLVNVTSVTLRYGENVSSSQTTTSTTTTGTESVTSSSTSTSTTSSTEPEQNHFTYNVSSSVGTNVNITSLQGKKILLGATTIPSGNVTGIVFNITGARAFYNDSTSKQLKVVADGKLMIPVVFTVQSGGNVNLTIDITPNSIHTSQGQASILTPVIHVTVVSAGSQGTTTHTVETSESETSTSEMSTSTETTTTTTTSGA